jgi:hypothetical protein
MAKIISGYNGPDSYTKATSDIAIPEYAAPAPNPVLDDSGLKQLIALQQREVTDIPLWMRKQQQPQPQPQQPYPQPAYPREQQMRAMQEPAPRREAPIPIFGKMTGGGVYGIAGMMNARPGDPGAVATGYVDPRWMSLARNAGPANSSMQNTPTDAEGQATALKAFERQAWINANRPQYSEAVPNRTGPGTYTGSEAAKNEEERKKAGGK